MLGAGRKRAETGRKDQGQKGDGTIIKRSVSENSEEVVVKFSGHGLCGNLWLFCVRTPRRRSKVKHPDEEKVGDEEKSDQDREDRDMGAVKPDAQWGVASIVAQHERADRPQKAKGLLVMFRGVRPFGVPF